MKKKNHEILFHQSAMLLTLIVILNGITIIAIAQAGILSSTYLQEIKTDIQLPEMAGKEVLKLYGTPEGIEVITTRGRFQNKGWEMVRQTFRHMTGEQLCLTDQERSGWHQSGLFKSQ